MSLFASLSAVGRPVAYYPRLACFFGSVNAAILFAQLHYWHDKGSDPELGVYKSADELTAETGLSYREQATARTQLRDAGYLIETNRRLEHRIYFRLMPDAIDAGYEQWLKEQFANDENAVRGKRKAKSARSGKRRPGRAETSSDELRKAQLDSRTETTQETTQVAGGASAPPDQPAEPMRVTAGNGTVYEIPADLKYPGEGTKTHKTWIAYAIAYEKRYGSWPVWNGSVAGQISNFIARVGADLAPLVAVHYVRRVNEQFITKQMHPVKLLMSDAEKWVTQTRTGRTQEPEQAAPSKFAGAAAAIFHGVQV